MRGRLFACLGLFVLLPFSARAQTTATYGEKSVGESCGSLQAGADFDTLFQCNTSNTSGGLKQKSPLFVGAVTSPPYAATTCDSSKAGMIQWTGTAFQGCDGTAWNNLGFGSCSGPSAFSFTNQTDVDLNTQVTSNTVTLSGFSCTASAVCSGCTILKNGTVQGTTASFNTGDTIAIRLTSSANYGTATTASVYVGQTSSGTWSVTTLSAVCSGTPAIGTVCPDGTIYAGLSPDGNVKMYTTPCDVGMSGTQGACTGTRLTRMWSYYNGVETGVSSASTGKANTATLYADNGNADGPYEAASYCVGLSFGGHSDWYLPAAGELNILYGGNAAIGGFDTSGTYWSSTERNTTWADTQRFSDGYQHYDNKPVTYLVRCARR